MHVLVVGDNQQAAACNCRALEAAGFRTELLTHAHAATSSAPVSDRAGPFDRGSPSAAASAAVVLDCHVPGCNGSCPLQPFRAENHRLPVLVLATHTAAEGQVPVQG